MGQAADIGRLAAKAGGQGRGAVGPPPTPGRIRSAVAAAMTPSSLIGTTDAEGTFAASETQPGPRALAAGSATWEGHRQLT